MAMIAALDATPLSVPTGGIRRYTEQLGLALARCFPADRFLLLSDQPFETPRGAPANLVTSPRSTGFIERRWWSAGLPAELRRAGAWIFHGTDFAVPWRKAAPAVMTLHDLSPWLDPRWQPAAGRIRRRTPWMLRLGRADHIVTPSEAVRREAMARFGLAADRVTAVPLAPSIRPKPRSPAPSYFLFVGTLEPRKNVSLLLQAWRETFETCRIPLVLAGRRREDFPAPEAQPGLIVRGAVSEDELADLYAGAIACLYPSLYEGFGLPVLEAMRCGCPVIASRDPAVVEAAGGAALLLGAEDARAWSEALRAIVRDAAMPADLRQRGLRRAAGFSWEATARSTREIYSAVLRTVAS